MMKSGLNHQPEAMGNSTAHDTDEEAVLLRTSDSWLAKC